MKKKLTLERVDNVETQLYMLKLQNYAIKREGQSEQSQKTLLLAQVNLMNQITDLWFEKAFTFEKWLECRNNVLENVMKVPQNLIITEIKRSDSLEELLENCLPHMSQFFAESTFDQDTPNYLSETVKSFANSVTQEHILKNS